MSDLFLIAMLVSLSSVSSIFFLQKNLTHFLNKNGHYLISFSAGVFLITSSFIIIEAFEITKSIWLTLFWIVLGFSISKLLVFVFPETHHHHDECCDGHKKAIKKIILGDSIHNIADGLVLASSFLIAPALIFPLALSIIIHEILQEISEFFVLKEAGYSTKKAIFINFLSSLTIFIGIGLGLYLGESKEVQVVILALSSGFFLNIVFDDLLPHQHKNNKPVFIKHLIILLLGVLAMLFIISISSHGH